MTPADDNLTDLRRRLYAQDQPSDDNSEANLSKPDGPEAPKDWEHDHDDGDGDDGYSLLDKLLIFAGIFFVCAVGFAAVMIGLDPGGISPSEVEISVSGPNTISAGQTTTLNVNITNNNQVALRDAALTISFPTGTRQPDTGGKQLRRKRLQLGTIKPKESLSRQVSASLFGQQGEKKQVDVSLSYNVKGSNAIFTTDRQYSVVVSELPVAMSVIAPQQTTPNQPVSFELQIDSNSQKTLRNLIVTAEYPFGFRVIRSTPQPAFQNTVWSLGNLKPGGSRSITITGSFDKGVSTGQRAFSFAAGIANKSEPSSIATLFANRTKNLKVREPFLDLAIGFNGTSSQNTAVFAPGTQIEGFVQYRNNADTALQDANLTLSLTGNAIDSQSVESGSGLYRTDKKQIIWNTQTNSQLENIQAGTSGRLPFTFTIKPGKALTGTTNPTASMTAKMRADSPAGSGLPGTITTNIGRQPRISSQIDITTKTLHSTGNGPIPPVAGQTTKYTAQIAIANTSNDITEARLQASLPAYVNLAGQPQTDTGAVSYEQSTGQLTWKIGRVPAQAGYRQRPVTLMVPLAVTPSNAQVGTRAAILEDLSFRGEDTFTGNQRTITDISQPTTELSDTNADNTGEVKPAGS